MQFIPAAGGGGAKYKSYVALVTQFGANAPVATVLQNELGDAPVWAYVDTGIYTVTLAGAFPAGKTYAPNIAAGNHTVGTNLCGVFERLGNDTLKVSFYDPSGVAEFETGHVTDHGLWTVEIRVYS